ncbi:division/cell wall cluster transcriptional repressor MraZ [Brevundimonas sp.]|uniref:division/cell wall cluster transcriptional repressor MraZ n=1 Tax=Brevundimonas sp. TaxID=1871086 RepID=UPI00391931E3
MFLSTYEKQLDAKRRLQAPQEFRTAENGAATGLYCFPSIEADCLEAGGEGFVAAYRAFIDSIPFGDPFRAAMESQFYGGLKQLSYDTAGRITLTEALVERGGLSADVVMVGLGDRFQIWDRPRWREHEAEQRKLAQQAMREMGEARRRASLAARGEGG